jgi:hypothetical protein
VVASSDTETNTDKKAVQLRRAAIRSTKEYGSPGTKALGRFSLFQGPKTNRDVLLDDQNLNRWLQHLLHRTAPLFSCFTPV